MYVGMHVCISRDVHAKIIMCIHTYRSTAKRTAPLTYLPTCRNSHAGANLSALRPRPAAIVAAADRRHQCALRDGLARPSLQRAADERAAKDTGVLTVGYSAYSPGTVSTHTCGVRRCARVIHRLDLHRRRRCRRTCSLRRGGRERAGVRTGSRARAPLVLSSVAGPAARSAPVVDNTLQYAWPMQTAIRCACNGPQRADP